jgi:ABC-2 type transport system permease protein
MYPVKLLPEILRFIAKINPLTYGIDALKHVLFPGVTGPMGPDFSLLVSVLSITLTSVLFVFIAARLFERKK